MELIPGEQILYRGRPSPRSSVAFFLKWGALALFPGVLFTIISRAGGGTGLPLWQWWLITILLLLLVIIRDGIRRLAVNYTVTTERIHIRRGLLSRNEQSTDIDRVQNVSTDQSVIERALNIGNVDFDTAGTDAGDASFRFAGVADPRDIVSRVQHFKIDRERRRAGEIPPQ